MPRRPIAKIWKGKCQYGVYLKNESRFVNKYGTLDYTMDEESGELHMCYNVWIAPVHDPWIVNINLIHTKPHNRYKAWMDKIDFCGYRYIVDSRKKAKFKYLINVIVYGYLRTNCKEINGRILYIYLKDVIMKYADTELVIFRDFTGYSSNKAANNMKWKTN